MKWSWRNETTDRLSYDGCYTYARSSGIGTWMSCTYRYLMSGPISSHSLNSEAVGAHEEDEAEDDPAIAGQVMGGGAKQWNKCQW